MCEILALSRSLTTNLRQHLDTSFSLLSATTYLEVLQKLPGEKEERNLYKPSPEYLQKWTNFCILSSERPDFRLVSSA